jgi:hypothetical protein
VDLSYFRFEHDPAAASLPPELAVLMVGVVARQAASPTAITQAKITPNNGDEAPAFTPILGAFDERTAARIRRWKEE